MGDRLPVDGVVAVGHRADEDVDAPQERLADILQHGLVDRRVRTRGLPDHPGGRREPLQEAFGGDAVTCRLRAGEAHDRAALRDARLIEQQPEDQLHDRPHRVGRFADVGGDTRDESLRLARDGRDDPVPRFEHCSLVDHRPLNPEDAS